jgi:hypothetical protein
VSQEIAAPQVKKRRRDETAAAVKEPPPKRAAKGSKAPSSAAATSQPLPSQTRSQSVLPTIKAASQLGERQSKKTGGAAGLQASPRVSQRPKSQVPMQYADSDCIFPSGQGLVPEKEAKKLAPIPSQPQQSRARAYQSSQPPVRPFAQSSQGHSQRVGRRNTQGTVDKGGSPVPRGYNLTQEDATVLEQYSAQVDLSSDIIAGKARKAAAHIAPNAPKVSQTGLNGQLPPPSHQEEVLSSNSKPKPVSPAQESRAITGIAVGVVNPDQLVLQEAGVPPATDPFTTEEAARKRPKSRPFPEFATKSRKQHQTKPRQPEPEPEDPDRTLVEPIQPHRRSKSVLSISSDESSNPDMAEEPASSVSDIFSWRERLLPHQMNVFDELIIISHRLVRPMVDHETATGDAADDYRRRCLRTVKWYESILAKEFKQYEHSLKHGKKRLRTELGEFSEQLQAIGDAVQKLQADRTKHAQDSRQVSEQLEAIK